jgi:hypothetical protein
MTPYKKLNIFHIRRNRLIMKLLNIRPKIFHMFIPINMLIMLLKIEPKKELNIKVFNNEKIIYLYIYIYIAHQRQVVHNPTEK